MFSKRNYCHLYIFLFIKGGDVMQENIIANVSEDTVTLEFLRLDGIYVSQLVDFTNVSVLPNNLPQLHFNKYFNLHFYKESHKI